MAFLPLRREGSEKEKREVFIYMEKTNTKSDFGKKGWMIIVLTGLMYFFFSGTINDGLNIIVGNYATLHGLDATRLLSLATPAAWFGLLGCVVWSIIVDRIGSRLGGLISLALGGACYALYGVVSGDTGFFVVTALVNFMAYGFCNTAAQTLIANWFPMRKGLALGWATMGQNLATAAFIPLLLLLIRYSNIPGSFIGVGIIMVIIAVVYFILVRDTPEELGCTPDNGSFTKDEIEANLREIAEYKSPWTPARLLKNGQVWLTSLGYGIYIMVTVSLVSQMIPRLIAGGWDVAKATSMMTVAAILGVIGSYVTGWLDQKIGTKKTSVLYGIWYLAALVMCALPANEVTLYLSVFFTGFGIGGIGNLFPSMLANLFNRHDFARALGVTNVISLLMRSFVFSIIAFGLTRLGGYAGAYALIGGLDVIGIILVALIKDKPLEVKGS